MTEKLLLDYLNTMLEEESFEDILERFNITPQETFILLFENGLIDEDLITHSNEVLEDELD